jgi:hypothetical protein
MWSSIYRSFADDVSASVGVDELVGGHHHRRLRRFSIGSVGSTTSGNNKDEDTSSHADRIIGNTIVARRVQSALIARTGHPNLILAAYVEPEPPPPPTTEEDGGKKNDDGDESYPVMTLRVQTPGDLTYIPYPPPVRRGNDQLDIRNDRDRSPPEGACSRNGAQWTFPTSHPKSLDHRFGGNVFRRRPIYDDRWELALGIANNSSNNNNKSQTVVAGGGGHCPIDADPYLPWIHDAFPTDDGHHVEFVISNKRRCNTDPGRFESDLKNLEPQVALMQPVPLKRIIEEGTGRRTLSSAFNDALELLWSPPASPDERREDDANAGGRSDSYVRDDVDYIPPRYALATSLDDADEDARYTRFICRFHTVIIMDDDYIPTGGRSDEEGARLGKIILGETLSTYSYNPEHANYRKRDSKPMLGDAHDEQIWNSVYVVRCPVPASRDVILDDATMMPLPGIIASGKSVHDGVPSIYVDLIPVRTPVRRSRKGYALPGVSDGAFDPQRAWGSAHVLPRIEASGRWENIPICSPPRAGEETAWVADPSRQLARMSSSSRLNSNDVIAAQNRTRHFVVACVWASHSFSTRGQADNADSSTSDRLREFLLYHLQIAGFDHVYVYDNSDATSSGNNSTLAAVTDAFSRLLVTRIPWPHRVCNNNPPASANPGERSSQYAAERSCLARYGPGTTWMATLDVDEYLISTGSWKTLRHWLEHVTEVADAKILSFYQTRALPNIELMVPYEGGSTPSCKVVSNTSVLTSMCMMKVCNSKMRFFSNNGY